MLPSNVSTKSCIYDFVDKTQIKGVMKMQPKVVEVVIKTFRMQMTCHTWRIIPDSKWLISPLSRGYGTPSKYPNGLNGLETGVANH